MSRSTPSEPGRPQLTVLQGKFLQACVNEPAALSVLMARTRVPASLLQRWLGQRQFRRALAPILRRAGQRRDASLSLAAVRAADRLAEAVDEKDGLSSNARHLCVELVKLARACSRRPARAREEDAGAADAILSPEALPELQQLLETLGESGR